MKANIVIETKNNFPGFLNIEQHDINNIDDGEAECIRAFDIIECYQPEISERIIDSWIVKLKHGGKLIISSNDAYAIARNLLYNKIDVYQANLLLFGESQNKKSVLTITQIIEYLESKKLKIIKKIINLNRFIVEAERQ